MAGTDALSLGIAWEQRPQRRLTRLPPEGQVYLFEQRSLAIPLGPSRVFLGLSFPAPELGWAGTYTDPLSLFSPWEGNVRRQARGLSPEPAPLASEQLLNHRAGSEMPGMDSAVESELG